jgi:hypothetical protein
VPCFLVLGVVVVFFLGGFVMAIQAQLYSENLGFPSCGSQDWIMENGCGGFGGFNGFSLNLQQKQQLQQQQQHVQQLQSQQQRNQNLFFDNSFLSSTLKNNTNATDNNNNHSHDLPMLYSQGIASQFEKQRQEIDQYIRLQVRNHTLIFRLLMSCCMGIHYFFLHCFWDWVSGVLI